jgi:hypothetical protein
MIATRIWFLGRQNPGDQPGGHLHSIMRTVLESGVIYSGTLVVLLVLFETQSWFQYVLIDSVIFVYAIGLFALSNLSMLCLYRSHPSL